MRFKPLQMRGEGRRETAHARRRVDTLIDRSITLLLDRAPPGARRAAEILSLVVGAIYLAGLGWAMWIIFGRSVWKFAPDGAWAPETSGSSWNTPAPAIVKLALLIGVALFLLVLLRHLGLWTLGRPPKPPERRDVERR